ncbi:MAG: cupin domain-containing protein [Bacteroidales bacterium]
MQTKSPFDAKPRSNPHGVNAKNMYDKPEAIITHITLKPGEQLRKHSTPVDVIFYVVEGSGTVLIGNETKEVSRDTLIESPKNIVHCWYNTSDQDLRFLVIKTPKPKEASVFFE